MLWVIILGSAWTPLNSNMLAKWSGKLEEGLPSGTFWEPWIFRATGLWLLSPRIPGNPGRADVQSHPGLCRRGCLSQPRSRERRLLRSRETFSAVARSRGIFSPHLGRPIGVYRRTPLTKVRVSSKTPGVSGPEGGDGAPRAFPGVLATRYVPEVRVRSLGGHKPSHLCVCSCSGSGPGTRGVGAQAAAPAPLPGVMRPLRHMPGPVCEMKPDSLTRTDPCVPVGDVSRIIQLLEMSSQCSSEPAPHSSDPTALALLAQSVRTPWRHFRGAVTGVLMCPGGWGPAH